MGCSNLNDITFEQYRGEEQLPLIQALIDGDLSEPYSVFTYRYFVNQWPHLCFLAMENGECIGCVVCKLERSLKNVQRGYIAMLAVKNEKRKREEMYRGHCEEVVLEAEESNLGALRLYENLGFIRSKRLEKYYLNGSDAFRLKLTL